MSGRPELRRCSVRRHCSDVILHCVPEAPGSSGVCDTWETLDVAIRVLAYQVARSPKVTVPTRLRLPGSRPSLTSCVRPQCWQALTTPTRQDPDLGMVSQQPTSQHHPMGGDYRWV